MAQPQDYKRQHNFTLDEEFSSAAPEINAELDAAAVSINALRDNLAKIMRDDGTLAAGVVTYDSLGTDVIEKFITVSTEAQSLATQAADRAAASAASAAQSAASASDDAATASRMEASATLNAQAAAQSLEKIADLKSQMQPALDGVEEIVAAGEHVDDIEVIGDHINELHAVGQDLLGVSVKTINLGSVAEKPDTVNKVKEGYLYTVAVAIGDVKVVSLNMDSVKSVAGNISNISMWSQTASSAATAAAQSADDADEAKQDAVTAKTDAETAASASQTNATESANSAVLSKKWATQESAPVEGDLYGAKYYAAQAADSAEDAETAKTQAESAKTAAVNAKTAAEQAQSLAETARDAAQAAANIQADWTETNTGSKAFIKNKPTLGALAAKDIITADDLPTTIALGGLT